jgi:hypothetical protein
VVLEGLRYPGCSDLDDFGRLGLGFRVLEVIIIVQGALHSFVFFCSGLAHRRLVDFWQDFVVRVNHD